MGGRIQAGRCRVNHSFNIDIAAEVGVEAAIIFENIQHWVLRNEKNGENIKDGQAWVYNSRAAWCEIFPYLGEKQIRNALERLLAASLVVRGTYSYGSMNRTYWYGLAERAKQYGPKGPNLGSGQKGQTKTVINNSINITPPKPPKGEVVGFEEFWSAYPRKVSKPDALRAWKNLKPDLDAVLSGLRRWKASEQWTKDSGKFIPYPATWLNRQGWNDAIAGEKVEPSADAVKSSEARLVALRRQNEERDRRMVEERRRQLGLNT